MAYVSKKKPKQHVIDAMSEQLLMSVVHARTKKDAVALLTELLSETERTMLAKRFAVIAMLARNYSFTQIEGLLKMSPDTVVRLWKKMKNGEYERLLRYARNNPKKFEEETFLDLLEKLLQAGMPPRGRGRWKWLKEGSYE